MRYPFKVEDTSDWPWEEWRALPFWKRLVTLFRFVNGGPEPWDGV